MALSHGQQLNALLTKNTQNKEDNRCINSYLGSLKSNVETLNDRYSSLKDQYATINVTLDKLVRQSLNHKFYEQPSYHEYSKSSLFHGPHSHHLHHKLCLLRVEVNKIDGLDPIGWVTQMEHYFSLHGITNELAKIC
jgi:hypothetical protein